VVLVIAEDLTQMRGVDDHPIQNLAAYGADPAFHDCIHAGCLGSGEHDPDAFGAEHLVEQHGEFAIPVTDHELERPGRSPKSIKKFLACWATQPAVGFAVTPRTCTRRVACSTTAKQYSRASVIVSA
jgi:hypothetical protein